MSHRVPSHFNWTVRYLTTAVVYFMCGLFKDAVGSPGNIVSGGRMSWEGCGRKVSWPRLGVLPRNA